MELAAPTATRRCACGKSPAHGRRRSSRWICRAPHLTRAHHFTTLGAPIEAHFGNALELLPQITLTHAQGFVHLYRRAKARRSIYTCAPPFGRCGRTDRDRRRDQIPPQMRNFYDYLAEHHIAHRIRPLPDDDDGVMLIQLRSKPPIHTHSSPLKTALCGVQLRLIEEFQLHKSETDGVLCH